MDYKKLIIRGISYSQTQSGAYALILEHAETGIKLPIVIGNSEAQSISIGLEKMKPPRPLSHDLFTKFAEITHYSVESVVIYKLIDGVFFANINFTNRMLGDNITLDARTSDAVAMAVRFNAPIYTTQEVISEAGILLDLDINPQSDEEHNTAYPPMKTMAELQEELEEAVANEDYDLAQKIQEEIDNRSKNID